MTKMMSMAAMLALMLVTAAPALTQTAFGGDAAVLQYSCDQVQVAASTQFQSGDGTGAAGGAQSLGINQNQVAACFGTAAAAQQSMFNVGFW